MPTFSPATVLPVSLERPPRYRVLRSYAGHLDHPADEVFASLVQLLEVDAESRGHLAIDASERFAVVQGAWWYRGEYTVREADGDVSGEGGDGARQAASIIEFEIFNLPARWRRSGPLAARAVIAESPYAFQRLLTAITDELEPAA